jgi:hypothetical protein
LRKHGGQVVAAPFQPAARPLARHLHRKRHVRRGRGHAQFGEQGDQLGVGALVEHQEPGVHPVADRALRGGQGDVHRVGVAAEVVARLEQRDLGLAAQPVRRGESGNA